MAKEILYNDISEIWLSTKQNERHDRIFDFICGNLSTRSDKTVDISKLNNFVRKLCYEINVKWKKANATKLRYLKWMIGLILKLTKINLFVMSKSNTWLEDQKKVLKIAVKEQKKKK